MSDLFSPGCLSQEPSQSLEKEAVSMASVQETSAWTQPALFATHDLEKHSPV